MRHSFAWLAFLGLAPFAAAQLPVTVTVTPNPSSVRLGSSLDYNATVTNTTNTSVTWLVNDIVGGNATYGTINSSGLFTAPAVRPIATILIKAKSVADPSKFHQVIPSILNPIPVASAVSPAYINVNLPTQLKVTGSKFVSGAQIYNGSTALVTTFVSATELRASLTTAAPPGTTLKIGVKNPDPGGAFSTQLNLITTPPVTLTVSPDAPTMRIGTTKDFNATVNNAVNKTVTWWAGGAKGGNSASGTIDVNGLYTPPSVLPNPPQVVIKAVSDQDTTAYDATTVNLQHGVPSISAVSPSPMKTGPNTITIDGNYFAKTAKVTIDGAAMPFTWISPTRINLTTAVKLPIGGYSRFQVVNPDPGTAGSSVRAVPISPLKQTVSYANAVRFLEQATFGPTPESIQRVMEIGREAWIEEQFAAPQSNYDDATDTSMDLSAMQRDFFRNALKKPDQLRQRMAFALGQLFVVSGNELGQYWKMLSYQRMFIRNAFLGYYTVMKEVALAPAMGEYLDMANNGKPDPTKGLVPNENYARENLQLFTIGLDLLNNDGTKKLNAAGQPMPAYTEEDVRQLSLMLTGWTYPPQPGVISVWKNPPYYYGNMVPFEDYHDTSNKFLLGYSLSGGRSAASELDYALTVIFNHPNVGPFVAYRLIQKLVTSNPSPAYVSRVASAFNTSPRGDLKAVVRAILLDPEAGTHPGATALPASQGHLREPVLFMTTLLRSLGATATDEPSIANYSQSMGQRLFYPPSVFNYYSPFYRIPNAGVIAPEFQLLNPTTALERINFVHYAVNNSLGSSVTVPVQHFEQLAGNNDILLDAVSKALLRGQMQADMKTSILNAINSTTDSKTRARMALYLAATSSRFQVQR